MRTAVPALILLGAASAAVLLAVPARAAEQGVRLGSGDRLTATIAADDEDAYDIDLPAGGAVEFSVTAMPLSAVTPDLRLLRPDGAEFDLSAFVTGAGTGIVKVKRFAVPAGTTGRWQLRVTGGGGTSGAYQVTATVTSPAPVKGRGLLVPASDRLVVPFVGSSASAVTVKVTPKGGVSPARIFLLDPTGAELPGADQTFVIKPKRPVKGRITLEQGLGDYALVLVGQPESDVEVAVDIRMKLPKVAPRKLTVPPEARVDDVTPALLRQGDADVTVRLEGTGFRDGTTMRLEGDGVAVSGFEVAGATALRFRAEIAADAPYGPRRIVVFPPRALGESFEIAAALTVVAPDPTVTEVAPLVLEQGTGGTITVTGTGFRPGGTVTVGDSGLVLTGVTLVSETEIRATYSVAWDATLSKRTFTYTQPAEGGGAAASLEDATEVVPHSPVLASVAPASLWPGTNRQVVRVAGDFFNDGTAVAFADGGITVHSTTFVGATALDVDVSVALDAKPGVHGTSIVTGPGGGPSRSFAEGLIVLPHDPVVVSFSHAALGRGASGIAVTVEGREFRAGDAIAASGSGVSFSGVQVTSPTTITATADVSAGAAAGLRALTVTHAASDGGRSGALANAFRVLDAGPAVSSVNPSQVGATGAGGRTREIPLEVAGTNFMQGAGVEISKTSGSGLSVVPGSVSVVSDTRIALTISLEGTATIGTWNVVVTNPGGAGSSGFSGANLLEVKPSTALVVQRVLAPGGGPYGGERVQIQGTAFAAGATVDFGSVRASGTVVIDANTIATTVPVPSSVSTTAATAVAVTVTNPGGAAAALQRGYSYAADDAPFVTRAVFPPQDASTVPRNLKSAVVVLSAPMDASTGVYGAVAGTNAYWYESGGGFTSAGFRGVGPGGRFLVFSRIGIGNLDIVAAGLYVLDIPVALRSIAGAPFQPTRLSALEVHDQQTFTVLPAGTDTTAPQLASASPASGASGVETTTRVVLTLSEEIDPLTVTAANVTLKQGANAVPATIALSDNLRVVTLTPQSALAPSTTYTVGITSLGLLDLCGNAVAAATLTFTTGNGTDVTKPAIDAVVLESIPSALDGSGTYVSSSGTPGQDFDLYMPRDGWSLDVAFSDAGGSGIDVASFSAKCSVAVGSFGANAELASLFTVTPLGASWRIPASSPVAASSNVSFSFLVKDDAGNVSATRTVTIDVADRDATAARGGDLDPFDARRTWVLRTDLDAFSATYASTASPSKLRGATTTAQANGTPDLGDALVLVGLGTTNMTAQAAAAVNGLDTGTNAILRRLVAERTRELLNERFGIAAGGAHGASAVDVEFLLPGEQGSLAAVPSYSSANASNSPRPFSEISLGGTVGADSNAYASSATLGDAWYDERNRREEANLNTGGVGDTGVHFLGALKLQVNANELFRSRISEKLVAVHGGTPAGEDASDDDVLAGSFDRTASANAAFNARYDLIMDAVEDVSLYASALLAHEIGHSLGLVADGAPKTGAFGAAHYANGFTEATSAAPNTSRHLDYAGNDIMAGASSFDTTVATGTQFKRFSPLDLAYLRNHLLYDEGK